MDRRSSADAERLELAMERRTLHADKFRGPRDIAGEAADLGNQVVALEHFPRLPERETHDVLAIAAGRHRRHHRAAVLRQHIGGSHGLLYGDHRIKFMMDGVKATPVPTVPTTGSSDHPPLLG